MASSSSSEENDGFFGCLFHARDCNGIAKVVESYGADGFKA